MDGRGRRYVIDDVKLVSRLLVLLLLAACRRFESPTAVTLDSVEPAVASYGCAQFAAVSEPAVVMIERGTTRYIRVRLCYGPVFAPVDFTVGSAEVASGRVTIDRGDTDAMLPITGHANGVAHVYYTAINFGRAPQTREIGTVTVVDDTKPHRRAVRH
jgi:hypothetical protein